MVVSTIYCVSWLSCFQSQIKCWPTHTEQRSLSARSWWVWKDSCMSKSLYFVSLGYLQILGLMPFWYKNNAGYCGGDNQADGNKRKGKGARNSVVSVVLDDATSGLSEKQSIIPAMVMWYLPVSDRLWHLFSNPKDSNMMWWWDSNKRKKGDGKLRHLVDAR